jgi:hypothetical protein
VAAISTSCSSAFADEAPRDWKSRLTSSSANGMYWLASVSTWSSSSASARFAATTIFLEMTAPVGTAIATCRVRVPRRLCARFTASATASRLLMLPSTTASRAKGSME